MTTICIAEKNRLTVRGVENGRSYFVKKEKGGWWIEPAPQVRSQARKVFQGKRDLMDHLEALSAEGFSFEPEKKENVPPCRF